MRYHALLHTTSRIFAAAAVAVLQLGCTHDPSVIRNRRASDSRPRPEAEENHRPWETDRIGVEEYEQHTNTEAEIEASRKRERAHLQQRKKRCVPHSPLTRCPLDAHSWRMSSAAGGIVLQADLPSRSGKRLVAAIRCDRVIDSVRRSCPLFSPKAQLFAHYEHGRVSIYVTTETDIMPTLKRALSRALEKPDRQ